MDKPVEPSLEDCCNSGCNPCIFDVYEKQLKLYLECLETGKICKNPKNDTLDAYEKTQLKLYQKWLEKGVNVGKQEKIELQLYNKWLMSGRIGENPGNGISQLSYSKFTLVENKVICVSHNLLTFQLLNDEKMWWEPGNHFLYKYSSEGMSCTRAYTPINVNSMKNNSCTFSIVVKKYDNGIVSTHLCNLKQGDVSLWRGPYGNYKSVCDKFSRIIMIAQGTGIAPLISIANSIISNEDDMTKIHLLYCCQCDDTILFRNELYEYQSYWNFNYHIYLSKVSDKFVAKYKEPVGVNKLTCQDLDSLKPFLSNEQFLICGSTKFNDYYLEYLNTEVPEVKNIILF